jgi:hypothetical protein
MRDDRWTAAAVEHDEAVRTFLDTLARVPPEAWQRPRAQGKWSPAALALHVCRAYEFGRDAAAAGAVMRLKVPTAAAWVSRVAVLPLLLALDRFPTGADAPGEVVPDLDEAARSTPAQLAARLEATAGEALTALRDRARTRPSFRCTHAYFGAMRPLTTVRLLSAHTRHHAKGLLGRR